LLLATIAILFAATSHGQNTGPIAVVGARLIDGTGGAPIDDAVVVITGDRIQAAGPRARCREEPISSTRKAKSSFRGSSTRTVTSISPLKT
jgi:hypothetical protein